MGTSQAHHKQCMVPPLFLHHTPSLLVLPPLFLCPYLERAWNRLGRKQIPVLHLKTLQTTIYSTISKYQRTSAYSKTHSVNYVSAGCCCGPLSEHCKPDWLCSLQEGCWEEDQNFCWKLFRKATPQSGIFFLQI